jgi:hypothetical protein
MTSESIDDGSALTQDAIAASAPPPDEAADRALPRVAGGLGGRIELSDTDLAIVKNGLFGFMLDLLKIAYGAMEKRVPREHVTSIEIVEPLIMPSFIRFSYAGSPPQTGSYLHDALAENALIMNPLDHRRFYEIRDRLLLTEASPVLEVAK